VAFDFAAARAFGGNAGATGVAGETPARGHAAITTDLAATIGIGRGDRVLVYAYGVRTSLLVDRVLPRRGLAGFYLQWDQEARNVLVSPATLEQLSRAGGAGAPPQWYVAVSNRGGVEAGSALTDRVVAALENVLPASHRPGIITAKRTALDQASASGNGFTQMFTAMGSFGVIAGLLLLVNLFVMLAAERKAELGMSRAIGLKRADLVRAFSTEGWLYSVVATALGVIAGVGLGRLIVVGCQRIFSSQHNSLDLRFTVEPKSLALGFAVSLAIAIVTVVVMSVRVSRLNIIRAIRGIPEPPAEGLSRRRLFAGAVAVAVGVLWTIQAMFAHDAFGELLGPIVVLVGAGPWLSRIAGTARAYSVLALLASVWGVSALAVDPSAAVGASILLYVAQGVTLTAAAVTLLSLQQAKISSVLQRLTRRSLSVRLGVAYPLARRARTGMTIATYALVIFILTFITTLASMIDSQVATATAQVQGGYAIVVSSSPGNPIPPAQLAALDGVVRVAPLATTRAEFRAGAMTKSMPWNLTAFDRRFVAGGAPTLDDRGKYASDAAAWAAVLRDSRLVIIDAQFMQSGGGPSAYVAKPGGAITVTDPYSGRTRRLIVAALAPSDSMIQNGALYGAEGARTLFGWPLVVSREYIALRHGVDANAFAENIQSRFVRNGAEASSIRSLMDEGFTMTRQIFLLFEGYLAMGLFVGIAGIAVVMIRAVRERRRQIGTLRAIGFPARSIGRSFAVEAALVAIEGTVVGAALALITLYNIVSLSDAFGQMTFSVPFGTLALLLVGTVAATLLATVSPAISASRIRPAVALRLTD
jgi:putative ABC transport system permease protein